MKIAPSVLSAEFSRLGQRVRDAADGGTSEETIAAVARAGATIAAVAGRAVYSHEAPVSMNPKSLHTPAAG